MGATSCAGNTTVSDVADAQAAAELEYCRDLGCACSGDTGSVTSDDAPPPPLPPSPVNGGQNADQDYYDYYDYHGIYISYDNASYYSDYTYNSTSDKPSGSVDAYGLSQAEP